MAKNSLPIWNFEAAATPPQHSSTCDTNNTSTYRNKLLAFKRKDTTTSDLASQNTGETQLAIA